jgi:cell division protease FtsH
VAEELIFGADHVSNGASGDIQQATSIARMMVTEWGMSDKLGMVRYGDNSQEVFLGHSVTQTKNISEETARIIDAEVRALIDGAYQRAREILSENIDQLHLLAKGLLEHETLSGDEIRLIIRGEPIVRNRPDEPTQSRGSVPSSGRPAAPRPGPLNPGPAAAT